MLISQMSFGRETSGNIAKWQLFSQATVPVTTWHIMQCVKMATHDFYQIPKCCLFQLTFSLAGRLCSTGFYILTELMCIIFAACFILRGRDTQIDFLRFESGRHDLLSDVRAFSLTSFEM